MVAVLTRVQNDLFDVGADFATPVVAEPEFPPLLMMSGMNSESTTAFAISPSK